MFKKGKKDKPKLPRGIEVRQKVTLRIAEQKPVTARVEELGEDYAILGLFREPDKPLPRMGHAEGSLELVGDRGAVKVTGYVSQHGGERDLARFDFEGSEVTQRREFFRIGTTTDVVVGRANGTEIETNTLDLSAAGMMLGGPRDLSMDERVWVAIDIGQDKPIRARGRVVRVTQNGHRGIRFEMIDEAARDRLIRYLFERERLARKVKTR